MRYAQRAKNWMIRPGVRDTNLYLVNDTFTTARTAGSVNGTDAEPGPGRRAIVDGNGKLSLSGGNAVFATGGVAAGDPGLLYGLIQRVPGRMVIGRVAFDASGLEFGWDTNAAGQLAICIRFSGTALQIRSSGIGATAVGAVALGTAYDLAVVQRAAGELFFIKGGAFTNWTLIYVYGVGSSAGQPGIAALGAATVASASYLRAPAGKWLPAPLASDGFSAWGTSDGQGHAEGVAGGLGGGGNGLAWTQNLGTWQASVGSASASALSSGVAIATVDTGKADVIATAKLTRSAGDGNVLVRYVDNQNWVAARHTGTNAQMVKNVAGVQTTLVNVAATYVAGAELRIICEGQTFRLYYNNAFIGTEQTIADAGLQGGTRQGLRTTDTANTFDDFVVYARGSGGEYAALDVF